MGLRLGVGLLAATVCAATSALAQDACPEQKLASPDGPGVRVGKDCLREEGSFRGRALWGQGKVTAPSGIVSEGQFLNGRLFGPGKVTRPDKRWHEGWFHDGGASGPGTYRDEWGILWNGMFYKGYLHGVGVLTFPNGGQLMGEFRSTIGGLGPMTAIYPDGKEETGEYRDLRQKLLYFKPAAGAPAKK